MKKWLVIATLMLGIVIGGSIQHRRTIVERSKLNKLKKEAKEKKEDIENMKKKIEALMTENKDLFEMATKISEATNVKELNDVLEEMDTKKPWKGDFREFMSDPNNRLDFG